MDDLVRRVRALWRDIVDAPLAFDVELAIVSSDQHRAAPSGWVGIVNIVDRVVIAAPRIDQEHVRSALQEIDPLTLLHARSLGDLLRPVETLGPAVLFYGSPVVPGPADRSVSPVDFGDERVQEVLTDVANDELQESGLDESTSGLCVATDASNRPVSLAGWSAWPQGFAHVGVLTRRSARGQGHAGVTAASAMAAAVSLGLTPQWRAAHANDASIGVARRLGLRELGWQYSLRLRGS